MYLLAYHTNLDFIKKKENSLLLLSFAHRIGTSYHQMIAIRYIVPSQNYLMEYSKSPTLVPFFHHSQNILQAETKHMSREPTMSPHQLASVHLLLISTQKLAKKLVDRQQCYKFSF